MADLPTVSREQLRAQRQAVVLENRQTFGSSSHRIPFAKTRLATAMNHQITLAEAGVQDFELAEQRAAQLQNAFRPPAVDRSTGMVESVNLDLEMQARLQESRRNEVSFGDQVSAAWHLYSGTQAVTDWVQAERFERDPGFQYWDHNEEIEEGLTYEENRHIRENAVSLESARSLRLEALERRELEFTMGARGATSALLAGLVGGGADPLGWAAGFGAGKALQLAGVGSRALYSAGQGGRAAASLAVESAAANVGIEAVLDAAGRRVDAADYAFSAAAGAGFGLAMAPLAFRGMRKDAAEQAFREIQANAQEQRAGLYATAQTNLGPGASAQAIDAEVTRLHQEAGRQLDDIRLAMPGDEDRFMPRAENQSDIDRTLATASDAALRRAEDAAEDLSTTGALRRTEDQVARDRASEETGDTLRAREDQAETAATLRQQQALQKEADEAAVAAEAGTQGQGIPTREDGSPEPVDPTETPYDLEVGTDGLIRTDPVTGKLVSEVYRRSDEWTARNPVDEARLEDVLGKLGRLTPLFATTAQQLLRSNHPVARMVTGLLLENTTGASGRRATAALDKHMMERIYLGNLEKVPDVYRAWRQANGGSGIRDWLDRGAMNRDFNRRVSEYRLRRAAGQDVEVDRFVKQAAEMYDRFYDQLRRDMVRVGTPGHEALPGSSTGYFSRRMRPEFVQNMTNAQRRALENEYTRQLTALWDDPEFAKQIASQLVEHARIQAAGGAEVPAHLQSRSAAPMIRNALASVGRGQLKLTEPEIEKAMAQLRTGGPNFTKSRLDLDMLSEMRDPETGETFRLMDVYETDQLKLALNYARRTSGEVALSKYGVPGERGLEVLRTALTVGRDGEKLTGQALDDALQAFDQIAAEFLGRPMAVERTGQFMYRTLDNLRVLTAASRLGGMAFTQFGEYANALPALGVASTMQAVKAMPRMINDVRLGRSNPLLDSVELVGGELGTDWKVNFPFQNLDDTFVHGQESMGRFTQMVRAAGNAVPHLNGWHYVQAAQIRGMAEQIIHRATKAVANPKGFSPEQIRMLDDMGIDEALRTAWKRDMKNVAQFDAKGNLTAFDVQGFRDPAVARQVVQAINRGARQIIQGSYVGETGLWAHDNLLRFFTQFRTFSLVSQEKQWTRVAALRGGLKTFGFLLGAMSWAIPIHLVRTQINSLGREDREEYLEQQFDLLNMGRSVLNYASLSGFGSDMLDVSATVVGATEGLTGLDSGIDFSGVRGISDGDVGAVVPGIGFANSTLRALTSGSPENLLRSLPGGNIPWAVPLLNAISAKETDDTFKLTDR